MGGDAVSSAQAGNDKVIIARIQIKLFLFLIRRSFLNTLYILRKGSYVPLSGNSVVGMGRRTATQVFFACPVTGVVA